jgi:hypothetical protein
MLTFVLREQLPQFTFITTFGLDNNLITPHSQSFIAFGEVYN